MSELLKHLKIMSDVNLKRLISDANQTSGIVPFVGAGLSVPFKCPGWREFLCECASNIRTAKQKEVQAFIENNHFEDAAEVLVQSNRETFEDAIERSFSDHVLEQQPTEFPVVKLLPRIAHGPVITTNFDRILEETFRTAGDAFDDCVSGADQEKMTSVLRYRKRYLLKIHGDWEDRSHRILTKTEYDEHYGHVSIDFNKPLPHMLQHIMSGRTLLFLGCSLKSDRCLTILGSILERLPHSRHFAIVEASVEGNMLQDRCDYLLKHGIVPIWYPQGEHGKILTYLKEIEKKTSQRRLFRQQERTPMEGVVRHIAGAAYHAIKQNSPVTIFCRSEDYKRWAIEISKKASNCLIWTMNGSPLLNEEYSDTGSDLLTTQDLEFKKIYCETKIRLVIFNSTNEITEYIQALNDKNNKHHKRCHSFEKCITENEGRLLFTTKELLGDYGLEGDDLDIGFVSCENIDKRVGGIGFQSPFNSLKALGKQAKEEMHVTFYAFDYRHVDILSGELYEKLYSTIKKRIELIDLLRSGKNPTDLTLFYGSPEFLSTNS